MRLQHTQHPARILMLGLFLLLPIAVIQLWIATAGFAAWSRGSQYVSLMADGFMHGRLSLMVNPPPELLALPDPYNPAANAAYRLHDALLYHGKYYLYWGPVPALLTAAVCKVLGLHPTFGDQHLVFAFTFGTVAAAALLMFWARARFFPSLPPWAAIVPILSLALGAPMLFTLARPAIYEATITAGQFFLMTGFLAAFAAVSAPRHRAGPAARWLALAGLLWALSAGSRLSLIPGIAATEAVTLLFLSRRRRLTPAAAAALVAPLLAAVILLGLYNYARFHAFTEFGQRWQLAGRNPNAQSPHDFFRLSYFPVDAYCYLFSTPAWLGAFPFIHAVGRVPPFAHSLNLRDGFRIESLIGLIWCQPICLGLILIALLRRPPRPPAPPPGDTTDDNPALLRWLTAALAAAGLIGFAPALIYENVTMRYLLDAIPSCTLLAALAYWRLLQSLSSAPRRAAHCLAGLIICAQSALGLLVALTGYNGNFAFYNPTLFSSMKAFFDRW